METARVTAPRHGHATRRWRKRAVLVLACVLLGAAHAVACTTTCSTSALCPDAANPCVVTGTSDVGANCILDFGNRDVVVQGTLRSALSGETFCIEAASLTLDGGKLRSVGTNGDLGGTIGIITTGPVVLDAPDPQINVSGPGGGGNISIMAAAIDLGAGSPALKAEGTTIDGDGGAVVLTASGPVNLQSNVSVIGGADSGGGSIDIIAGNLTIQKALKLSGGSFGGGELDVSTTAGGITLGSSASIVNNGGSFDLSGGDGGQTFLTAAGNIILAGDVRANGAADADGGNIDVDAEGNITVLGPISADGGGGGGNGGNVTLSAAGTVEDRALISADGSGDSASGGTVTILAADEVRIFDTVRSRGGTNGSGDTAEILAGTTAWIGGTIDVDGQGGDGCGGLAIVSALGNVIVDGTIEATGGTFCPGGDIDLDGLGDLVLGSTSVLRATGGSAGGRVTSFKSTGSLTLLGTVDASSTAGGPGGLMDFGPHCSALVGGLLNASGAPPGSIVFRTAANGVTIQPIATVTPSPTFLTVDPGLRPCCGNGVADPGEDCDDGNLLLCDGCTEACTLEPDPVCTDDGNPCTTAVCDPVQGCLVVPAAAEPCPDDGNPCTDEVCNSATGACGVFNSAPCDDGNPCTQGDVCVAGACQAGTLLACGDDGNPCTDDVCNPATGVCGLPHDATCDDGNPCTENDRCSGGLCVGAPIVCAACEQCDPVDGCVVAPRTSCRTSLSPERARLLIVDRSSDDGDRLQCSLAALESTPAAAFGDPTTADGYALCMYAQPWTAPSLLVAHEAPAGGTCSGRECWKAKGLNPPGGRGYRYKDRLGTPDGVNVVLLKPGSDGRAKIALKGKGHLLGLPPLEDVTLPLLVQIQASNGECWEASFFEPGVLKRDPGLLKIVAGSASAAFLDMHGTSLD